MLVARSAFVLPPMTTSGLASIDERLPPVGGDILVVDDVSANLVAMEAALEPLARRIVTVHSGRDALAKLLHEDFSLILLDVQMPDMDGFETAALIRSRDRNRHTPIVFVTAHDRNDAAMLRGYTLGAVDFLFKPINLDVLRAKTRALVELADAQARQREHALQHQRHVLEQQATRTRLARHDAPPVGQLRTILIEDDDDVRELTADLLASYGHGVVTASNGSTGLDLLCSYPADVALIDIGLPDIDGCEVVRQFRQRHPEAKTRLVAMTGYNKTEDRSRIADAGFELHLVKPMRLERLLACLRGPVVCNAWE